MLANALHSRRDMRALSHRSRRLSRGTHRAQQRHRRLAAAIEMLEVRQLLATTLPPVTGSSGISPLASPAHYYDVNSPPPGWILVGNQTISVPAFDSMGGTRVLIGATISYNVDLVTEFL